MAEPSNDWFLSEWMDTLGVRQVGLIAETGWPKGKVSKLVNGKIGYTRSILNEAAKALRISPFELLMHPDDAMRLRRLRQDILAAAADARVEYTPEPPDLGRTGTHG